MNSLRNNLLQLPNSLSKYRMNQNAMLFYQHHLVNNNNNNNKSNKRLSSCQKNQNISSNQFYSQNRQRQILGKLDQNINSYNYDYQNKKNNPYQNKKNSIYNLNTQDIELNLQNNLQHFNQFATNNQNNINKKDNYSQKKEKEKEKEKEKKKSESLYSITQQKSLHNKISPYLNNKQNQQKNQISISNKILISKKLQKQEKQAIAYFYNQQYPQCFQNLQRSLKIIYQASKLFEGSKQNQKQEDQLFIQHEVYIYYLLVQFMFKLNNFKNALNYYQMGRKVVQKLLKRNSKKKLDKLAQYIIAMEALNIAISSHQQNQKQTEQKNSKKKYQHVLELIFQLGQFTKKIFEIRVLNQKQCNQNQPINLMSEKVYKQIFNSHIKALMKLSYFKEALIIIDEGISKNILFEKIVNQKNNQGQKQLDQQIQEECYQEIIFLIKKKIECIYGNQIQSNQKEEVVYCHNAQNLITKLLNYFKEKSVLKCIQLYETIINFHKRSEKSEYFSFKKLFYSLKLLNLFKDFLKRFNQRKSCFSNSNLKYGQISLDLQQSSIEIIQDDQLTSQIKFKIQQKMIKLIQSIVTMNLQIGDYEQSIKNYEELLQLKQGQLDNNQLTKKIHQIQNLLCMKTSEAHTQKQNNFFSERNKNKINNKQQKLSQKKSLQKQNGFSALSSFSLLSKRRNSDSQKNEYNSHYFNYSKTNSSNNNKNMLNMIQMMSQLKRKNQNQVQKQIQKQQENRIKKNQSLTNHKQCNYSNLRNHYSHTKSIKNAQTLNLNFKKDIKDLKFEF